MKKTIIILALLLCSLSVFAADLVIQTNQNTQLDVGSTATFDQMNGQSFILPPGSDTWQIDNVTIRLLKFGSPTDNVVMTIFNDTGATAPDLSSDLQNLSFAAAPIAASMTDYTFSFSTKAELETGVTMWVVFQRSGTIDGSNYIRTGLYSTSNDYPNGTAAKDGTSSSWPAQNHDLTMTIGYSEYVDTTDAVPNITQATYNVTSGNIFGENSTAWRTNGSVMNFSSDLLSLTFDTDVSSNCSMRLDTEQNYTEMIAANSNYKLATTDTTSHSGTLFDSITHGNHSLYISCISNGNNETPPGVSTSGQLNLTLWENLTVTLDSPANDSLLSNAEIDYLYTPYGNDTINQCSLYHNATGTWVLNETNSSTHANATQSNFNNVFNESIFIEWNVECCNDKTCAFAPANYTFNLTLINLTSTLCENMTELIYRPNISNYNVSTGTLTEYNITPTNMSLCAWVYNITVTNASLIQAKTNYSLNQSIYNVTYNGVDLNSSYQVIINATAAASYQINTSFSYYNASAGPENWTVEFQIN